MHYLTALVLKISRNKLLIFDEEDGGMGARSVSTICRPLLFCLLGGLYDAYDLRLHSDSRFGDTARF